MKIVTSNDKKYLRISRHEWELIGRAFEVKKAYSNKMIKQAKIITEATSKHPGIYLPKEELMRRLPMLGFNCYPVNSEHAYKCQYPEKNTFCDVVVSNDNVKYENENVWHQVYRDFRKKAPYIASVLYNPNFIVPPDFKEKALAEHNKMIGNIEVKEEKPEYEYFKLPFARLPQNLISNQDEIEVKINNQWERKVEVIDSVTNTIMLGNGDLIQYPNASTPLTLRRKIT